MNIRFTARDHEPTPIGKVLHDWWRNLENDHASRAIVRRATSPMAVALTWPYQRLYRRLLDAGWPDDASGFQNDRLAAVVGLLVHVREDHEEKRIAKRMSEMKNERPLVSELRFLRLLDSPDTESLFSGLRRVLPLIGYKINVLSLVNDLFFWGDAVKKRWAYDYQWPKTQSS